MSFIKKGRLKTKETLPEQNYQRIIQNAKELVNKIEKEIDDADSEADAVLIGDGTDKLAHYTSAGIPRLKVIGGNKLYLESDDGSYIILDFSDGTYVNRFLHSKADGTFDIQGDHTLNIKADGSITIRPSNDNDDYLLFSTSAGVPSILPTAVPICSWSTPMSLAIFAIVSIEMPCFGFLVRAPCIALCACITISKSISLIVWRAAHPTVRISTIIYSPPNDFTYSALLIISFVSAVMFGM